MSQTKPVVSIEDQLQQENEALVAGLRGKHALTGATYETLIAQRDVLIGLLQQCRSRVEGMQAIQGRHEQLGHTKLLAEIDEVLARHGLN